jgi:hypothetical protein
VLGKERYGVTLVPKHRRHGKTPFCLNQERNPIWHHRLKRATITRQAQKVKIIIITYLFVDPHHTHTHTTFSMQSTTLQNRLNERNGLFSRSRLAPTGISHVGIFRETGRERASEHLWRQAAPKFLLLLLHHRQHGRTV